MASTVAACRELIETRFADEIERGAAAMLLDDGTIHTGTAPDVVNPAVELCHEVEPLTAAFRLGRTVVASVCLAREAPGRFLVLSPCGVCRERLAAHGPNVVVAVPTRADPAEPTWLPLHRVLPHYWAAIFDDVPWR
ncbi:cytidine deaminase [Saccharomonospora sp. CUA-673]|nr:cytidine deaminase [Saccharomonospora sp. CUA-673]